MITSGEGDGSPSLSLINPKYDWSHFFSYRHVWNLEYCPQREHIRALICPRRGVGGNGPTSRLSVRMCLKSDNGYLAFLTSSATSKLLGVQGYRRQHQEVKSLLQNVARISGLISSLYKWAPENPDVSCSCQIAAPALRWREEERALILGH